MSLIRYANTDEQEEAIRRIEEWAKKTGWKLHYGTSIGKKSQTIILDHQYQDNFLYVYPDGEITIDDEKINSEEDFFEIINFQNKKEEE